MGLLPSLHDVVQRGFATHMAARQTDATRRCGFSKASAQRPRGARQTLVDGNRSLVEDHGTGLSGARIASSPLTSKNWGPLKMLSTGITEHDQRALRHLPRKDRPFSFFSSARPLSRLPRRQVKPFCVTPHSFQQASPHRLEIDFAALQNQICTDN